MLKEDWLQLAKRLGYESEFHMLRHMYEVEELPISQIAARLGFHPATMARRISLLAIDKRSRGGANNKFTQRFKLWRSDQRVLHCFGRAEVARALQVSQATLQMFITSCTKKEWPNADIQHTERQDNT